MIKSRKIIQIIPLMFLSFFIFSSNSSANEVYNPLEHDSIYKYNALENKVAFVMSTINTDSNTQEEVSENDNAKPIVKDDISVDLESIINQQEFSIERSNEAMNTIEGRSGVRTFLIGNNLGILKFQIVQLNDQAHAFSVLSLKTKDKELIEKINDYIYLSEEQRKRIEDFIREQEDRFSMFGWFVSIL